MKTFRKFSVLGILVGLLPLVGFGALTRQKTNLLGKFYVSSVSGTVTCYVDGKVIELKKGDTILARGTTVKTAEHSNITLVFSNQTAVYTDEKSRFEVEKFDQEFFAPNNNLRIEPSNSSTIVRLREGRMVINTPRLQSGTSMVYETEHAAIMIKGDKILIEADQKQTHVVMIAGIANVNVRDNDGSFVSIGKRITTGQEAFVKKTLSGGSEASVPTDIKARNGREVVAHGPAVAAAETVTKASEAIVIKLTGLARVKLPGAAGEISLAEGTKLPVGALISTEETSEVLLQPFPGMIATLRAKSSLYIETLLLSTEGVLIKKQTTLFDLRAGTVISTLDPVNKDVNDYRVRTPKGIASARGGAFSVSVEEDGFSVAAIADKVFFVTSAGLRYSISAENITITPPGGDPRSPVTLASAIFSYSGGETGNAGDTDTSQGGTSIIVRQFDPNLIGDLTFNLGTAQGEVQFDTQTGSDGTVDIRPVPTTPDNTPTDHLVSPANGVP